MKKLTKTIFIIALFVTSNISYAGWTDEDRFEPLVGCGGGAGYYYWQNQANPIMDNVQGMLTYCLFGFLAGHGLNKYYERKYGEKGRKKYDKLKKKTEQFLKEVARARSEGVDVGKPRFKEKRIPGGFVGGGEYQGDSIRYIPYVPSDKMILGD